MFMLLDNYQEKTRRLSVLHCKSRLPHFARLLTGLAIFTDRRQSIQNYTKPNLNQFIIL